MGIFYDTLYIAYSSKIFHTDLKGLLAATGSGDKKEFLSFHSPKLSVKPALKEKSIRTRQQE